MADEGHTMDDAGEPAPLCRGSECLRPHEKDERNVVRCIICYALFHIECVSVSTKDKAKIWTCSSCRKLTKCVQQLQSHVFELKESQSKMLELITKISQGFEDEKTKRRKAEEDLKAVRSQLSELVALSKQATSTTSVTPPLQEETTSQLQEEVHTAPPLPNLLLGTSLLRNVDPTKLDNWEVTAKGGATIADLHKELAGLSKGSYSKLVLVCGSIDLESKSATEVIEDYQAIVATASTIAESITISSILPRADKDLSEKIKDANADLKHVSGDIGVRFADNDGNFYVSSGSINKAMLTQDGLHLTKHGVDCLLDTCGVKVTGSAFTHVRYSGSKTMKEDKVRFRGHAHPLSNFYPVAIKVKGKLFKTAEAAYQHNKAETMGDRDCARKIQQTDKGITAMRLAEKIKTNKKWSETKLSVMESIVKEKIRVCPNARKVLLESGSKEIVEDTPHEYWGRGRQGQGQNQLGKLWMKLRSELQKNPDSLKQQRVHSSPSHNQSWATRDNQPRCYQCGETGHLQRQCNMDRFVACWSCGRAGHKAKDCWTYQRPGYRRSGYYY